MSSRPDQTSHNTVAHNPHAIFNQAAAFYVATVGKVAADRWDSPGLGEWSVRDLVGHTSRSLLTVETYLDRPASAVEAADAVEYYVKVLQAYGDPAAVTQRGREAAAALGADPAGAVREIAARVGDRVASVHGNPLLTTPAGGMTLEAYLPTRVFELVVHTLDLANAIGARVEPPAEALALTLHLAANLALRGRQGESVVLALTGRQPLPDGFSVV